MTQVGQAPQALVGDLLAWVAETPRSQAEAIEVWRTSCPRLTVWEDALEAGLLRRVGRLVELTPAGREFLASA